MLGSWGRVLRLSLAPTAVADVLAGLVLGFGGALPEAGVALLLVAASLCVYHGGMVLNDWADREIDARSRPRRPLPAGELRPTPTLVVGLALLCLGPALAFLVGILPGFWLLGIALLVLRYDLFLRGPLQGPFLLAACRAGNLGIGLAAAGAFHGSALLLWSLPFLYGGYVFTVSRMGRLEDAAPGEVDHARARSFLLVAAALLVLVGCLPPYDAALGARFGAQGLALFGALGLGRAALSAEWSAGRVEAAMGIALRRLLVFTAAASCLAGGPQGLWVAAGILCGFPVAWGLRRVFPPS